MTARIKRQAIAVAAACAMTCLVPPRVQAEPGHNAVVPVPYMLACGTTKQLVDALSANGESIAAHGTSIGGPITQFWINPATSEWSVVFVDPLSGQSCLVAAGRDLKADRNQRRRPDSPDERGS